MNYDTLIMTTERDFLRLQSNYHRLVRYMQSERLIFVGNKDVGCAVEKAGLGSRVEFLDENEILRFDSVNMVMQEILKKESVPRGITGWYYQQFLKMQYALECKDEYYLVWDGDTIPCRMVQMFCEEDKKPYLDMKREYHEEYFRTLSRLFPDMKKNVDKSYISEHMLMKCSIMKQLIHDIEQQKNVEGKAFYEKILHAVNPLELESNSFSEFETYGTYVSYRYPESYEMRDWHSFRYGAEFFDPEKISDSDYEWLGRDFDAITFEKNQSVREDHKEIFTKKEYQQKLSARQILEIAQQEFEEGYLEVWDE